MQSEFMRCSSLSRDRILRTDWPSDVGDYTMEQASAIRCKTCDTGQMIRKRTHRMSGPAVFVGYLFLIPSALGIITGMALFVSSIVVPSSTTTAAREDATATLRSKGVSEDVIADVLAGKPVKAQALSTYDQQFAVSTAESRLAGANTGAGAAAAIGAGFALFLTFCSFVGGLIGYLLTMKKKILQCTTCEAVVQAS